MGARRNLHGWLVASAAAAALAGCGGGGTATVGGTVTGLATGTAVTLKLNGKETLVLGADGGFRFTDELISEQDYDVTIVTQPADGHCDVQNGRGHIDKGPSDVDNVTVLCTPAFTLGGTLTGLTAQTTVTLNNGTDEITLSANGPFTFPTQLPGGTAYAVTITTQPTGHTCTVNPQGASGTMPASDVANVFVNCT